MMAVDKQWHVIFHLDHAQLYRERQTDFLNFYLVQCFFRVYQLLFYFTKVNVSRIQHIDKTQCSTGHLNLNHRF